MEKPPSPQPHLKFSENIAKLWLTREKVPILRGMPPEEGLTLAQMFEDFVVTFSLTCVDEAIARELFARMVTAELYRETELPSPRDLEVTPRSPESFAGVDLVSDAARLHHALRRAAHKLGRYIDKAYLFAVTNNYVPLRTGVLDPLLRDPLDSTQWAGLAGTGPIEGSRPMATHLIREVVKDDLEVLQTAVREVREFLGVSTGLDAWNPHPIPRPGGMHVWDPILPPILNHIDFIFDLNRRPRTAWPGMMEMMPSEALRTWLERIQVDTDLDWIQPAQRERYGAIDAAWRTREFNAKLQTVIHADLIPLLRQHRDHPALKPISAYLSEALSARWRPSAADMQKLHGPNGIPRGLEMEQWERPYNLTEEVSLQQALFMAAWQRRVYEHGAQPTNLIRSRKDLLAMHFVRDFVEWAKSTETQGAADELWRVTTEELFDQAQALPLPFVRHLLEPIVLLGEFVPTRDRNYEGTPFARNLDVKYRGFPEGMIAAKAGMRNAAFTEQHDLCRIDRLPFYFPDPSDQATLSAYLAQAFAHARDFARDNVPPFVTHMRGFVCLNRPNVEEVLAHWVPGVLPMRELDAHFGAHDRPFRPPPGRDRDSDSEDSSSSSSPPPSTQTPRLQVRSAGQSHSTMAASGLKEAAPAVAARLQVVPRSQGFGVETRLAPKKDFCLNFNRQPARCELKHKCAPRTSESASQQDRAYLLHDQAYQMRLQQRNASIMTMPQHNARTGRPPVQTPPTRAPPSRPPSQGPEYRDAQLARQQKQVAHSPMTPDEVLAAKCRQHAMAWGVQAQIPGEETMDIDFTQHVALEQHWEHQKAQRELSRNALQPTRRSILQELEAENSIRAFDSRQQAFDFAATTSRKRDTRAPACPTSQRVRDADSRAASEASAVSVEYDSTGTHDEDQFQYSDASHSDFSDNEAAHSGMSDDEAAQELARFYDEEAPEPIEVDDLALATEMANELYQLQRQNSHQPGWLGPGEVPPVMKYIHRVPIASPLSPSREQRQAALDLWQKDLMADLINEVKSGDELLGPGYQWALGALSEFGITEADFVDQHQTLDGVEELLDGLNIPLKQRAFLVNAWPARKFFVQELRKRAEESHRTLLGISWIKPISTLEYEKFLVADDFPFPPETRDASRKSLTTESSDRLAPGASGSKELLPAEDKKLPPAVVLLASIIHII